MSPHNLSDPKFADSRPINVKTKTELPIYHFALVCLILICALNIYDMSKCAISLRLFKVIFN